MTWRFPSTKRVKAYAYRGDYDLGTEPLNGIIHRWDDLKSISGARKRARSIFGKDVKFKLFTYEDFKDKSTFREIHEKVR